MDPRTVENVVMDFKGRRAGIMKALTKDTELCYQSCDPNQPVLCLYGYPDQTWEVNLAPPSELPEPRLGINFVRDAMPKQQWISMVALHSDAWLHAVASYYSTKHKFDKADRKRLFCKIMDVPPICEAIMGGMSKKRSKIEDGGLPDEVLVEEVLARLPVKDLIRYRSVCKKWRGVIDDQDFVSSQLKIYKPNIEGTQLLVIEHPKSWMKDSQVLVRRSYTFRKIKEVDNHDLDFMDNRSTIVGHINGLMLFKRLSFRQFHDIMIWNPSINKSIKLPEFRYQEMKVASFIELGFGFDSSHNDYKVIAITYSQANAQYCFGFKCYQAISPGSVQVYALKTNTWTVLDVKPPSSWIEGPQVFVKGVIHWMNLGPNITEEQQSWDLPTEVHSCDKQMQYSYIVSFNVGNEVLDYFKLPCGIKGENFLTVMEGSLAMFSSDSSHNNEIWVMKDYGNSGSWSKCYTFTLKLDPLLCLRDNGELLFAVDGKGIKSYDVKRDKVRDLAKTYSRNSKYNIFTHVESLVLSNHPSVIDPSASSDQLDDLINMVLSNHPINIM